MALVFRAVYCAIIAVVELKEVFKDYILKSINVTSFFTVSVTPLVIVVDLHPAGGRFSKAPETFRARKAIAKFQILRLQSCFIHVLLV